MRSIRLSIAFAKADVTLRNEGSYLGILWYVVNPLVLFVILLVVFSRNIGSSIEQYPLYVLFGVVLFNVFRQATVEATRVLYNNRLLIKSINFPREALVLAAMVRVLFAHLFEVVVFALLMFYFGVPLIGLSYYVGVLIVFVLFLYGLSLCLSAISVYFLDIEHIWSAFTQALWFATPIFYSIGNNPFLLYLNSLNPMYYFITLARDVVIYVQVPDVSMIIGGIVSASCALVVGQLLFLYVRHYIPERF